MNLHKASRTFRGYTVPHFKIIEHKKWWFLLSGAFIALSILGLAVRGLNLSIEFKGGAQLVYTEKTPVSPDAVRATLAANGRPAAEVQVVNGTQISIRTETLSSLDEAKKQQLLDALAKQAGVTSDDINIQDIGPTWGSQISQKMLEALIIFLVLVSIYIAFRFEWKMAVAAQTALAHDIIITAGIYALTGREVTPNTVIAILTILGYSLYDTVVIFDKIQENTESAALVARDTYSGVVNTSLNQTLMRSVNTSLVVLLPILSLLLFGGATLKDFAFALFVGVLSGTYSSIFVASPMLAVLKEREPRYRQLRAKADQRAGRDAKVAAGAAVAATGGDGSRTATASSPTAKAPASKTSAAAPAASRANLPASVTQPRKQGSGKKKKRKR